MKRYIILSLLALTLFNGYAQQAHVTEVQLEPNERWWGCTERGLSWASAVEKRPDSGSAPTGFTTRMLVSSAGRYLWSGQPMTIIADGQKLVIEAPVKVDVQKGGKTLREAYLVCVHKNIAADRHAPDTRLLTAPVYRPGQRDDVTWGQQEITAYARRIVDEGLPVGTIVIPFGWQSLNVPFAFCPELFPDPGAMMSQLHDMGFRVMLTVSSQVPALGRVYTAARREGTVGRAEPSPQGVATAGFRMEQPAVAEGFTRGIGELMSQYPIDGCRLDYGVPAAEEDGTARHNWQQLANGMEMCILTATGPCQFAPYASATAAQPDEVYRRNMIDALIAASLSGDPYKTAELHGLEGLQEEQRLNYMLAALFYPVASVDLVPWEFKERKLYGHLKDALLFRASIADYIENLVRETVRTGEPIARSMEYQFPRNGFADCDDQFMLGPKYLIAPCLDGSPTRMVRLPKGRWTDKNGVKHRGPVVLQADCNDGLIYFESTK